MFDQTWKEEEMPLKIIVFGPDFPWFSEDHDAELAKAQQIIDFARTLGYDGVIQEQDTQEPGDGLEDELSADDLTAEEVAAPAAPEVSPYAKVPIREHVHGVADVHWDVLHGKGIVTLGDLTARSVAEVWRAAAPYIGRASRKKREPNGLFSKICAAMAELGLCFSDSDPREFTFDSGEVWLEHVHFARSGLRRPNGIWAANAFVRSEIRGVALLKSLTTTDFWALPTVATVTEEM